MGIENLDKVFKPKSIAVIGASDKVGSAGHRIFRNLIGSGYDGIVFPVNPKRKVSREYKHTLLLMIFQRS